MNVDFFKEKKNSIQKHLSYFNIFILGGGRGGYGGGGGGGGGGSYDRSGGGRW